MRAADDFAEIARRMREFQAGPPADQPCPVQDAPVTVGQFIGTTPVIVTSGPCQVCAQKGWVWSQGSMGFVRCKNCGNPTDQAKPYSGHDFYGYGYPP